MVDTNTSSDFGTSSGLPEQLTGTVADAWFGRNEAAEGDFADKQFLWLKLINIESDEYDGDEYTVRVGLGNGWEAIDGGKAVVRSDGSTKQFNGSTAIGKIINRCLGHNGGKEGREFQEAFTGALDALQANAGKIEGKTLPAQQYASIWVGLRFEFAQEEYSSRIGGEETTWSWTMPAKFVGVDERVSGGSGGGSAASAAAAPAENGNGGESGLVDSLKALAKTCSSHSEFVQKALAVDGVTADQALLAQVADESDNGLFAQANA
jgi:hypothetical protein